MDDHHFSYITKLNFFEKNPCPQARQTTKGMRNPSKALKWVGVSGVQVTHGDTRVTNLATRTNGNVLATSRCTFTARC
jgi:hypothetical protein